MKTAFLAIALMASGAAIAQTDPEATTTTMTAPVEEMDHSTQMDAPDPATTTSTTTTTWAAPMASTGSVQAPSNANPEHDARGIAVISDAAMVPAGFNGTAATGVGGPVEGTDSAHPACTREVTDNCVQTYERGRSPQ